MMSETYLGKNLYGFRRNRSNISQISTICQIIERERAQDLKATLFYVDFYKILNQWNDEVKDICLLKETVKAIMMTYYHMKALVH